MFYNKNILSIIPARGGSKGIKNKNLKKINSLSLVELAMVFINSLEFVDLKIVSTDSDKILKLCKKYQHQPFKRTKKFSGDRVSDFQVISNVINNLKKITNQYFDYLLYLQPTSPFRKKNEIISALKKTIKTNSNSCWSISVADKKYHPLKILKINSNQLNIFNNKGQNVIARQQLDDIYIRNGIFYIFDIKKLMYYKKIYLPNTMPYIINYPYVNIDSLNDLKLAKKIIKKHKFN